MRGSSKATVLLLTLTASATYAQERASTPPSSDVGEERHGSVLFEEVVVTARKRATGEAVQDTPIAMTAFAGDQFKAVFADKLEDLSKISPNVQLKPSSQVGAQNFTIRGMGVSGTTASDEPAVGIVQDGVYWGVNYGAALDTFDVESIEILRGPQGTLFGRNVTGGAILVRTARPTGQFGLGAEAIVGDYGRRDISARIEGPVVKDVIAAKLTVLNRSFDGYFNNLERGDDFGAQRSTVVRGTIKFTPIDTLDATLILEHYKQNGDSIAAWGAEKPGTTPYTLGYRRPADYWDLRLDNPGGSHIRADSAVGEVNWQVLQGVVTSISAYREVAVDNATDFDGTQFSLFNQSIGYNQHQASEELRYASKFSDIVDFTAGLYYFTQGFRTEEGRNLNLGLTRTVTAGQLTQSSYAGFGEADVHFSSAWTLTLGARYTRETKRARSAPFAPALTTCANGTIYDFSVCNFNFGQPGEHTWSDFSPKVVLSYKPVDHQLIYASATRGFRSGGYSLRGNQLFSPFDSEQVTAYEVGYKGDLLERRLRLNLAGYWNKYKDLQRTVLAADPVFGVVQSTFNVADATIKGVEVDLTAQATDALVFTASYGLTDAKYDSAITGFNTKNNFTRVPKNTYSLTATYDIGLGAAGDLQLRASGSYTDSEYFDDANTILEPSYTLYDASVTYTDPTDHWTAAIFGKNLSNEEYAYWGSSLGALGSNRFVGPPRTVGLRVSYKY